MKSWLWVALCTAFIFSTIPLARSIQKLVYATVGKEFFTYAVFFIVFFCLAATLYFMIFKYRVKKNSQYIWLFLCAGVYIYYTFTLRKHPEEALHFVEYGVLSYFFFKALSFRIRDWTIYITVVFFVALVGTFDEFIQWLMPGRIWDYRDIGFNMLSGVIFMLVVWKGIRPAVICEPVKKYSVKILAGILTANLIFLGLCHANTPDMVKRYTAVFESLSWLRDEEPMKGLSIFRDDPAAEAGDCTEEQ